jgi:hypothetical protein
LVNDSAARFTAVGLGVQAEGGRRFDRYGELLQTACMMFALVTAAAQAAASPIPPAPAAIDAGGKVEWSSPAGCKTPHPSDLIICGKRRDPYRIDPNVLEASREVDALPPKPPVTADATVNGNGCVGPSTCQGGVIPLVGMAIVAAKAAALAANGDDWREAIRIHEDEYRLYKQAEERRARERRPRFGFSAK